MFFPNRRLTVLPSLLLLLLALVARGEVIINEIMYRPGTGFPENTGLEFIELHNTATAAVDVSGWSLTSGVAFTLPASTVIPASGFLVIAADPAQFLATYGIGGALGPWAAGATLSNRGEKITLSKPGVQPGTLAKVDEVTYASEGDWALRIREGTFGGWDWSTPANGAGTSMELRNPAVSNDNGQNWAASTALAGATPGAANSVLSVNIPPVIHGVKHFPAIPKSTDNVTISCQLTDETPVGGLTATLFWRTSVDFQSAPMTGDGSGVFSAILGPKNNLTIVEFYISASDGVNTRTWPAPTSEGQNANCQYQVDNETLNATDSYYRLILTAAENAAYETLAGNGPGSDHASDRQFNQTLVVVRGADTTIRYRCGMRIRGNSSRNYQFKPLRVIIPNDDLWDGASVFNLNPKASFLQYLGARAFQAAGLRNADSIPVELRRNGIESTTSTGTTPDYGKWTRLEDDGGDLVDNHWPTANGGNLYKKVDNGGPWNFYWRSGQPAPANPDLLLDGWSKQNKSSVNDWSDLTGFFTVWQNAAKAHFPAALATDVAGSNGMRISGIGAWNSTAFTPGEMASVETVADLDQWARWLAVMCILQDLETKISNGVDDDYSVYFVPSAGGQRRMQLLSHDLDTILGLGDNPRASNYTGLYDATEGGQSNYAFRSLLPLLGTTSVAGNDAFRAKYFTAIRELYGTVFDADTALNPNPAFYQFLDNHLGGWVPAAVLAAMKTFATQRQTHLLGLIGSAAIVPPVPTSSATVVSAPGTLMIHKILANNVAAVNVGGAFPDIIEIRNTGAGIADLTGMSLTDDPTVKAKYVFPAGTTIASGGYLTVYADSAATAGLHTGFGLDQDGDTLQLYGSVATGQTLRDTITFGAQPPDYSIGRTGGGLATWALCTTTLGAPNVAVPGLAAPGVVKINEWFGNAAYQFDDDFLELYNPAAQPVALGGMVVTDDFINYPAQRILPPLTFMAPASFLRMNAKGSSAAPGSATDLPFKINSTAGWLALIGQNGSFVDRVDLVSQAADTSTGRSPDGGAIFTQFGLPTGLATPGASNTAPPANILALMNGLRITELLYTPGNREYVELQNIGATTLDLSGVRLTKGITYTFAAGTAPLAPGGFLVVCKDHTQFGGAVPLAAGIFANSLSDSGESVALRLPAPWEPNILNFAYDGAWYPATATGASLSIVNAVGTAPSDWKEKTSWLPSVALYGTPGNDGPPNVTSSLIASSIVGDLFQYQITGTKFPTSYNATPLPAGLSVDTVSGLISGTPQVGGTFNVSISATNAVGPDTRTLVLTIADSGPLARFAWSAVAAVQQTSVPFGVTLTAQDAQGRTVTAFNGSVDLTAAIPGIGSGATIVFTEAGQNTPDFFEIQNVSNQAVNTTGWFVTVNNGTNSNPNATHTLTYSLPASTAAGQVLYRTDSATENYWGENIFWTDQLPGWAMLVDNLGVIRDFVAWRYTAAEIQSISVIKGGFTLNPSAQGVWSGAGVPNTTTALTLQRGGSDDHHDASDWSGATQSRGVQNAGLTLPFLPGSIPVPMTPASVAFTAGVFTGSLTPQAAANSVRLTATDGSGHTGLSNLFNIIVLTAPVITSPLSAVAVVGQPFSYQILATELPTGYNATNLSAGLSVNTTTGLIFNTPTVPGTKSVTLSASNLGGTGNATLSLEVQADADGDGMGDAWEMAHGLNPASFADAATDRDGDGQSNRAEWLAGTSPDDAASRLVILSEQIVGTDIQLTWSSVVGKRYRVLHRPALGAGAWTEITPAPIVATGVTANFTHLGGFTGIARFYRVEIVP